MLGKAEFEMQDRDFVKEINKNYRRDAKKFDI